MKDIKQGGGNFPCTANAGLNFLKIDFSIFINKKY